MSEPQPPNMRLKLTVRLAALARAPRGPYREAPASAAKAPARSLSATRYAAKYFGQKHCKNVGGAPCRAARAQRPTGVESERMFAFPKPRRRAAHQVASPSGGRTSAPAVVCGITGA